MVVSTSRPSSPKSTSTSENVTRLAGVSHEAVSQLVHTCKLLADETRIRILNELMTGNEVHVRGLCERLGQNQPVVSHHLAILREAGLIALRRDGKHHYYRATSLEFEKLLQLLFAELPNHERNVRLGDYVLSYSP